MLLLTGARKSKKDGNLEFPMGKSDKDSFSFDAMELKYLLNSLLITLRLVILTLSMTKDGLMLALVLPLRSLMIFHVLI